MRFTAFISAALGATALACAPADNTTDTTATQTTGATTAPRPTTDISIEVDRGTRQLTLIRAGQPVNTYPVAVGSSEWPTAAGDWHISQVVWNPEWKPPRDESWAKDEEDKAPGAADNPLGRVQLIYDPPRTIHGTNEPTSIGKAVSHGSIRMRNEDAIALARVVMESTGAGKDSAWYQRALDNRTEKVIVDLPAHVPIRVR